MARMYVTEESYKRIQFPNFEDVQGEIWSAPVEVPFEVLTSRNQEAEYRKSFVTFKKNHATDKWDTVDDVQFI